jgi:uncharacterized membrane protein
MDTRIAAVIKAPEAKWACLLGIALGGFFDGILLHQVLQWRHFLSLVPGMDELRLQILWDGYFHVLMYVVAVIALWGLWRARRSAEGQWSSALAGVALLGFGIWNWIDVGGPHWILGIHRVRVDTPNPLL